jgi:hypothetical protein
VAAFPGTAGSSTTRARGFDVAVFVPPVRKRLVLLYHWTFDVTAGGSFRDCMQGLDVGLAGDLRDPDGPAVTDTGHLAVDLYDRAGTIEPVWYRGPLVAQSLSRDTLGPYHSADQARRVSPETGGEDVSYAAAFEVGRLLAAADPRLAQELMRWRTGAYEQAARAPVLASIRAALSLPAALDAELPRAVPPTVGVAVVQRLAGASVPSADPTGLSALGKVPGLDPAAVAQAWQLTTPADASAILRGTKLAAPVAVTNIAVATPPGRNA